MKIFKLELIKDDLLDMIDEFKTGSCNSFFIKSLERNINKELDLSDNQFSVLYYMASILKMRKEGTANVNTNVFDFPDMTYSTIQQRLYISLLLSKPDGEKFAKGSMEFSDEQYTDFNESLMRELLQMAQVASEVLNIDIKACI